MRRHNQTCSTLLIVQILSYQGLCHKTRTSLGILKDTDAYYVQNGSFTFSALETPLRVLRSSASQLRIGLRSDEWQIVAGHTVTATARLDWHLDKIRRVKRIK